MGTDKRKDESDLDYHRRLIYGKLVDKTLADEDYSELSELVYGKSYASDVARRMMYGSCRTLEILDEELKSANGGDKKSNELDERIADLQKERQKFYDMRNEFNRAVRDRSRMEEVYEILERTISCGNLPTLDYEPARISHSENDLLVSLNDIHYGAQHSNYWSRYDPDICEEMMRRYLDAIIDIASRHESENCIVWENGDAISGMIHANIRMSNKENVVGQIIGVSELIAQFLTELSKHFVTVRFVSVAGNHSRIYPNKDDAPIDERLDDLLEWYLKARLQNFDSIIIGDCDKIDPTIYTVDIRGVTYCGVHGDYEPSDRKILDVQAMVCKPVYAILMGHKHHNKQDCIQGTRVIMAGSFLGTDDHCVRNRIVGRPQQLVCVCNDKGIVCSYDVNL